MNVYMCVVCGFIYNEAEGRPEDGIPTGTLGLTCRTAGCVLNAVLARPTS